MKDDPVYSALSYTWGDPTVTEEISVDGSPMQVTTNLKAGLKALRAQAILAVWIDALCINQEDILEREQQVLRMQTIYSKAAEVIIWLGPKTDDSALAMSRIGNPTPVDIARLRVLKIQADINGYENEESVSNEGMGHDKYPPFGLMDRLKDRFRQLDVVYGSSGDEDDRRRGMLEVELRNVPAAQKIPNPLHPESHRTHLKLLPDIPSSFEALMKRPYWNRIWITQEVAMARALKMLCGSQCVEWRQVLDFVRQSQIVWPEIVALEKLRVAQQGQKDDPDNCLPASPTLTDDLIADGFESKPLIPDPNKRPALGATIIRTRHSLATDERDKVYGLLGLCDDSKWLVPRPSYRIPAARVFFGVVRNYILWEFRDTGYQYLLRELPLNHELRIDSEWKTNWVDVSIGLPHLFLSETGNPWVPMQPMFRGCFPACHGDFEVSTWCTLVRDSPLDVESQQTIEDHKSKKVPGRPSETAAIECENAQRKKPKDSRRISSRSKPEDHIDRWPSLSFSGLRTHLLVKETITSTTHDSQSTSAGGARDPGPEGYDVGLLIDPSEARNVINRFLSAFIDWSHCAWWTSEERTTAYAFTSLCLESK
jgi:hypothetical protein